MSIRLFVIPTMLLAAAGCADSNTASVTELASTHVNVFVEAAPDAVTVSVQGVGEVVNGQAETSHCLRLRDSTTITANGIAGTLTDVGGFRFGADGCDDAYFKVPVSGMPDDLRIVIDDGTAQVQISLQRTATTPYWVAGCGADMCYAE